MKSMGTRFRACLLSLAFLTLTTGTAPAEPARHVVDTSRIQARLDQQARGAEADRQALRTLLARPDVRALAGSAGLDLRRASAAVGVASDEELRALGARAAELNAGVGGQEYFVISATALIIILLLILIIAD